MTTAAATLEAPAVSTTSASTSALAPRHALRFEPLSRMNLEQWLEVARHCWYASVTAVDESWLTRQLQERRAEGNIILFQGDQPVALLPGVSEARSLRWVRGVQLKRLTSFCGGLLVRDEVPEGLRAALQAYANTQLVQGYYRQRLKADVLEVSLPLQVVLQQPGDSQNVIPFGAAVTQLDTVLYAQLSSDLLQHLRSSTRYEVRKGLQHIRDAQIQVVTGRDDALIEHLELLERQKAATLGCAAIPRAHFIRVFGTPHYHALLARREGQPQAAVIYTRHREVATYHFNASTEEAKKQFVNKALLFLAMQQSFEQGARWFVLGDGRECSARHPNVAHVASFKRSFSTHERLNPRFLHPLSMVGWLVTTSMSLPSKRIHAPR